MRAAPNRVPDSELSAADSLKIVSKAYQDASEAKPFLPSKGSVLPALLALRRTHQTAEETNAHIQAQVPVLEQTKKRLDDEKRNQRDQQVLQAALEKRVAALREGLETREDKTSDQLAKEKLAELKKQKTKYNQQTTAVMKELGWFIETHLEPMLAAEELGGPVVGELMDIDPDDLSAGFTAHGKLKRAKEDADDDKRQRRIDDIWGPVGDQPGNGAKRKRDRDEATAAGAEMRDLTELLLNQAMESGGDSSAAYIPIPKESAAVRFLVRSKVAEFHPRDSQRLRLVDFGKELDD